MTQLINYEGQVHEFPDDFSEEDISNALGGRPKTSKDERSFSGFLGNILSSGRRMAGDIATSVTSPVQTAKAMGNLALGVGQMVVPGEQGQEKNVEALAKMYVDRYGSWDNFTKTLYEDPVGVLADLSVIAGGTGAAVKGLGIASKAANLGKTANALTKMGQIAGAVGEYSDPIRMAGRGVALAEKAIPQGIPERLYQSALKPSLSIKNTPKIPGQLATGLREGIPVSEGGIKKISSQIKDLRKTIDDKIHYGAGTTVDPEEIVKRLDASELQFTDQALPKTDLASIESARRQWLERYAIRDADGITIGYRQIPVEEAQKIKKGTYRINSKKYNELSSAQIEAEKALARGIKEELEGVFPELKNLNAREGALIELQGQLKKAIGRTKNWEIFTPGIYGSLGGIGTGMATGSVGMGAATATILTLLRNPNVKSRLAIALKKAGSVSPSKYKRTQRAATVTSRIEEYIKTLESYQPSQGTVSVQSMP